MSEETGSLVDTRTPPANPFIIRAGEREGYSPANHSGTTNRRLIGPEIGARYMELLLGELEHGGMAKPHAHRGLEQAAYILEGTGEVSIDGHFEQIGAGDTVFFPEGAFHSFEVTSERVKLLVFYAPPYGEDPTKVIREGDEKVTADALSPKFLLTSPSFGADRHFDETFVFNGLGCTGDNVSPEVEWSGAPEGTKSFALMVHDPHAITGGAGVWHWVVVDIPADVTRIVQGAGALGGPGLPAGARQIPNDYAGLIGGAGWGGPCPPPDHPPHDYVFTLYALPEAKLDLPDNATASHYGFIINRTAIGKAELVGRYGRH